MLHTKLVIMKVRWLKVSSIWAKGEVHFSTGLLELQTVNFQISMNVFLVSIFVTLKRTATILPGPSNVRVIKDTLVMMASSALVSIEIRNESVDESPHLISFYSLKWVSGQNIMST